MAEQPGACLRTVDVCEPQHPVVPFIVFVPLLPPSHPFPSLHPCCAQNVQEGKTALHLAISSGHVEVVRALLRHSPQQLSTRDKVRGWKAANPLPSAPMLCRIICTRKSSKAKPLLKNPPVATRVNA